MAYVKTVWVNGTAPALNDSNLNKIEQGIFDSLQQDGTTAMTGQLVTTAGSAATPAIAPTGDANTGISFPAADTIAFSEGGTEVMRIASSGNVGIGTTSPSDKLEVVGGIRRKQVTAGTTVSPASEIGLQYQFDNTANRSGIYFLNSYNSNGAAWMSFWTSNTSNVFAERMRIDAAGNVGIGTTNPTNKLQIDGVTANTSCINAIANTTAGQSFGIALSAGTNSSDYALNIRNAAQTTQLFHITGAGNVGIGTTSPAVKFVVESNQASFGSSMQIINTGTSHGQRPQLAFYNGNTANPGFLIGKNNSGDGGEVFLANEANTAMLFVTNGLTRLTIEGGGTTRPFANNTYDLGSATYRWATIYAQNALNTSDARLKTDVVPSSLGLDFISALNPVQFRYIEGGNTVERVQTGTETVEITPAIPAQPEVLDEEGNVIQEATEEVPAVTEEQPIYEEVVTAREGVRTHFGLIAQEVKAALPDGLDFGGWALADKEDAESTQFLGYMELIAPMIKAIQELKAEIDTLKAQLAQQ